MRPDRIIVGECRGDEAVDMLQAMNTGHAGSMTTLHANSTADAIARLETMVLMGRTSRCRRCGGRLRRRFRLSYSRSGCRTGTGWCPQISESDRLAPHHW